MLTKRRKDNIVFDLPVNNYNSFFIKQNEAEVIPLILILVILPSTKESWIKMASKKMIINAEKYWFHLKNIEKREY